MKLCAVALDHPDAAKLVADVQQEYVRRYGEPDITRIDPAEFAPPGGHFLVGYLDDVAVACGGWRAREANLHDGDLRDGDAELKRMYVVDWARGRGLARVLLAELENSATAAGRRRLVLETGTKQPEAIALYTSSGYTEIPKFGMYRGAPDSCCFGKELRTGD